MPDLWSPFDLGDLVLPNQVVMAPMTRSRAGPGEVATQLTAEYYRQRASAGLIVSEGAQVSEQGRGYVRTPGIHDEAQVVAWRTVTDAVHAAGGRIFCQLWHVGRLSHRSLQPGGALPVAPSAVGVAARVHTGSGFEPVEVPRALAAAEIPGVVDQFRHAADCARRAGFDGVELHAAGGYLIDQFLRDGANRRDDDYGGPIARRLRFLRELVEAVASVIGARRVGVRIAPLLTANGITDSDPEALFVAVAEMLDRYRLAYLHVIEAAAADFPDLPPSPVFDLGRIRRAFRGPYIVCYGYDAPRANRVVARGEADLVGFGRPYIANPDLVERLRTGGPLADPIADAIYTGDAHGYTDYPTLGPL